jgi:predicted transcriptional regulator
MPDAMVDLLQREMECEGLLDCLYGLKALDRDCYRVLTGAGEPLTVDAIAERIDRERSTAYRAIRRLVEAGLVHKEQVNYDQGGYYHVFYPADPDEVADDMQRVLNDWYAMTGRLIHEFRETYGERVPRDVPTPRQ